MVHRRQLLGCAVWGSVLFGSVAPAYATFRWPDRTLRVLNATEEVVAVSVDDHAINRERVRWIAPGQVGVFSAHRRGATVRVLDRQTGEPIFTKEYGSLVSRKTSYLRIQTDGIVDSADIRF